MQVRIFTDGAARGNPDGPQCIRWCPVQCLGMSGSSVMLPDGVRPEDR